MKASEVITLNCRRLRQLVNDPRCWDSKEILFVIDRLEKQALEKLRPLMNLPVLDEPPKGQL